MDRVLLSCIAPRSRQHCTAETDAVINDHHVVRKEMPLRIFDWLAAHFAGKRIGIVGPRAAGKATMHTWLRDGVLPTEYRPTAQATPMRAARPKLTSGDHDDKLAIKGGSDVTGDALHHQAAWRNVIDHSDVLVYLFDASLLLADDAAQRRQVVRDCGIIGQWIADRRSAVRPRVALVGTHCDLIAGYAPDYSTEAFIGIQRWCWTSKPCKTPAAMSWDRFTTPLTSNPRSSKVEQ